MRRALKKMPETDAEVWLRRHLDETTLPLLGVPWILDVDTTVKPLFGHQEGAVVGYNPHKPGRPSHTLHTYWVAGLRLVLDVEVKAGNEHSSAHSAPALWELLDRLGRDRWPWLLRGDADFGTERIMSRAEQEGMPYLFKLRSTRNVKRLIEKAMGEADWTAAGQGWQGKASTDLVSFPGLWVCRADVRAFLDEGRHGWLLACQCRRFQIWMPYPSTS